MKMRILAVSGVLLLFAPALSAAEQEWRFKVYLDDKEIGYHEFLLREQGEEQLLESEASFEYKLLFVKLYGYEHENRETWQGNCLTAIESRTDANGQPYRVSGVRRNQRFVLIKNEVEQELPDCVMSFAYWNPAFLRQQQLLNSQNGELVDVEVSEPEAVDLMVRGENQPALRYRLSAGELAIQLWYSEDDQWLALESEARGGRRLRYELL